MPTVPGLGPSTGPVEIASPSPAAAPEAATGSATFGQILTVAQGHAPAASANTPLEQPAAVSAPAALPVPREPLAGSPEPAIQRVKAPAHQKNDRHAKKTSSSPGSARSGDSTVPVTFAPVPVPEPAPPPGMAADPVPSPPSAMELPPVSGQTLHGATEPGGGQTRQQPLPTDAAAIPDTSGSPTGTKPQPVAPATMTAGAAGNNNTPFQTGASGTGNTGPATVATPSTAHVQPPPFHAVTGASATGTQAQAEHKSTAQADSVAPAPIPPMAETPPQTPPIQSVAVPASTRAHQALPAAQVAPALLTLAKAPDGTQQMTVRLNPDQLGMVQIRLDRAPSGATHIQILADRPETLQALQRDQPALHKTLDEAGIPNAGRTIAFHDAPHADTQASNSGGSSQGGATHTPAGRSWANGQGGASGGAQAEDRGGSRRSGYPARSTALPSNAPPGTGVAETKAASTAIYRVRLNITA